MDACSKCVSHAVCICILGIKDIEGDFGSTVIRECVVLQGLGKGKGDSKTLGN